MAITFPVNAQDLPRNSAPIIEARMRQMRPANGVVVSFIGGTPLDAEHVFADPGRRYDWRFLAGLRTFIVTRPGVDCGDAMRGLYDVCDPFVAGYPVFIDVEREQLAYIVESHPLRLWQVKRASPVWAEVFPWN